MKHFFKFKLIFLFLVLFSQTIFCEFIAPRLTVVIVIDQCGKFYSDKLGDKFCAGLDFLQERGVVYENARHPHSEPGTAPGHAALNTGVYAKDHGVVGNDWFDGEGNKIYFPEAKGNESYFVFDNNGETFDYTRCPDRLMATGISDSFALSQKSGKKNLVYAISLKDRAAIATAGFMGKPIWYDQKAKIFTSSKAYFETLPEWLKNFNNKKKLYNLKSKKWEPAYKLTSSYYDFKNAFNYDFTSKKQYIGTEIEEFELMPYSNDVLFDLAETCIENTIYKDKNSNLLLWLSLSSLDKVGHLFGPDSAECIDTLYHIDKRLEKFIKNVYKKFDKSEVLFVLTADHGISPIPELARQQGIKNAYRIKIKDLVKELNELVMKNYGLKDLFFGIENKQLFLNKNKFNSLDPVTKSKLRIFVKSFLKSKPGIKDVWCYHELVSKTFAPCSVEFLFKNQLFPGRSGEFIINVYPFCQLSNHDKGTTHACPCQSDTHVPLIFYQKGAFESKKIKDNVLMLQFANTLAEILKVQKAQQSSFGVLPGLFDIKL